jgi:hypothetical protein
VQNMISQFYPVPNEDRNEPGERIKRWNYTFREMPEGLMNFASTIIAKESLRVSVKSHDADVDERVMQRVLCLNKFLDEESRVGWRAAPGQLLG